MLDLCAGQYDVPTAGLCFALSASIQISPHTCIFVRGENGVGKTTFLEHVLIPQLRPLYQIVYVAQDVDVQASTMRATLALLQHQAPDALPDLVQAWICAGSGASVLILDEFDKYMPHGLPAEVLLDFFCVFCVSHTHTPSVYARFEHGLAMHLVRPVHHQPIVQVNVESLWSRSS
ncbi:hypothetical protein MASR1M90_15850 [Desulfovibrionales bacterium]